MTSERTNEDERMHPVAQGSSSPVRPSSTRDVALVGIACMFAGAGDVRRYWENICRRVDSIREVPPERWRVEDFFSEDRFARDRVYSRWGGFLDKVFFDPVKWRIPPASLQHIEPMQLLSLEIAWQAMVDAGYDPLRKKSEIRNPKSERNSNQKEENTKGPEGDVSDLGNSDLGFRSDFGFRISD